MQINKRPKSSIDLDIHNTRVPSSAYILEKIYFLCKIELTETLLKSITECEVVIKMCEIYLTLGIEFRLL